MENKKLFKAALIGRHGMKHDLTAPENINPVQANRMYRHMFMRVVREYMKQPDAALEIAQCVLLMPAMESFTPDKVEQEFGPRVAMLAAEIIATNEDYDPQTLSQAARKVIDMCEDATAPSHLLGNLDRELEQLTAANNKRDHAQAIELARSELILAQAQAMAEGKQRLLLH